MLWKSLLAVGILAPNAYAILRFGCTQLSTERLDPLVNPGQVGTPHVHQIIGGNAFSANMAPEDVISSRATCTTCEFSEDFSNYWTATLYFQHPTNKSFKRVPQRTGVGTGVAKGGFIVYYTQGEFALGQYQGRNVTAFKKGFRMISGDPLKRTLGTVGPEQRALTFRCFSAPDNIGAAYPGGGVSAGYDTYAFPTKPCPGGIRSQVYFPTCWDGKNLDSPDHKSHVAFSNRGTCPASHPVGIPEILYEIIWDTTQFNSMWPSGGKNPFLFSMGDRTGYGQHGDYLFGWKDDSLERAMKDCNNGFGNAVPSSCKALKTQAFDTTNKCLISATVKEDVDSWLSVLPGNPLMDPDGSTPQPTQPQPQPTPQPTQPQPQPTQQPTQPPPVPTPQPQPTQQPAPPGTVPKFGQCGGLGWAGPTQCQPGTTCQVLNDWFSQCA